MRDFDIYLYLIGGAILALLGFVKAMKRDVISRDFDEEFNKLDKESNGFLDNSSGENGERYSRSSSYGDNLDFFAGIFLFLRMHRKFTIFVILSLILIFIFS